MCSRFTLGHPFYFFCGASSLKCLYFEDHGDLSPVFPASRGVSAVAERAGRRGGPETGEKPGAGARKPRTRQSRGLAGSGDGERGRGTDYAEQTS